jgi:hypothetical protein
MPKISVPKDIQTLINALKLAYEDSKEEAEILEDKDLEGLNKDKGKQDRQSNVSEYSVNASRILDFLVFRQSNKIIATLKEYDNTITGAAAAALAVYSMMNKHVDAAIDYLDDKNGIPTITSEILYKKVLYLNWFLARVVAWSTKVNGEQTNYFMTKIVGMIHDKVESRIGPMSKRLEIYENENKLEPSTMESVSRSIAALVTAKAEAKRPSQAFNSQRIFTPGSPTLRVSPTASSSADFKLDGDQLRNGM